MKFKAINKKPVDIGGLGVIQPGDEFEVLNEKMLPIFKGAIGVFEEVKEPKKVKKIVKKEE